MPPGASGHGQGNHGGGQLLAVEPGAVPRLRSAFLDALARVDRQIELARAELRVAPWAADPVSQDAAKGVNAFSTDEAGAALEALVAFRGQLDAAVENLDRTAEQYRHLEEDNQATVSHKSGGQG